MTKFVFFVIAIVCVLTVGCTEQTTPETISVPPTATQEVATAAPTRTYEDIYEEVLVSTEVMVQFDPKLGETENFPQLHEGYPSSAVHEYQQYLDRWETYPLDVSIPQGQAPEILHSYAWLIVTNGECDFTDMTPSETCLVQNVKASTFGYGVFLKYCKVEGQNLICENDELAFIYEEGTISFTYLVPVTPDKRIELEKVLDILGVNGELPAEIGPGTNYLIK